MTTLRTWQKCQTPRTLYEQPFRLSYSSSFLAMLCQSWHRTSWILDAQMTEHVSGPSIHSASPEILFPFSSCPLKMLDTSRFLQNDMEHNHPEKRDSAIMQWDWKEKKGQDDKKHNNLKELHVPFETVLYSSAKITQVLLTKQIHLRITKYASFTVFFSISFSRAKYT